MALSAAVRYENRGRGIQSYVVENSEVIYYGALVGLDINTGRLQQWDTDSNLLKFRGIATPNDSSVTGNSAGTVECPVDESGRILEQVTVTGVSGQQHVGELVYATDDNTFTLTATTNVGAIGEVVRWYSSTTCDVRLWTPAEYRAQEDN